MFCFNCKIIINTSMHKDIIQILCAPYTSIQIKSNLLNCSWYPFSNEQNIFSQCWYLEKQNCQETISKQTTLHSFIRIFKFSQNHKIKEWNFFLAESMISNNLNEPFNCQCTGMQLTGYQSTKCQFPGVHSFQRAFPVITQNTKD